MDKYDKLFLDEAKAYENRITSNNSQKLSVSIITAKEKNAILRDSYKKSLAKYYETFFLRDMVDNFLHDGSMPLSTDNPLILAVTDRSINRVLTKPPFMFITINPRIDYFEELSKKVEKFVRRKIVAEYAYAYEHRNASGGLHCHLLLRYIGKPHEFKRCAKSTFKNICDVNNPHILNFKFIEEEHLLQKYNYLKGDKSDKKKKSVQATMAWRKAEKIPDLVESTPQLPCRGTEVISDSDPQGSDTSSEGEGSVDTSQI